MNQGISVTRLRRLTRAITSDHHLHLIPGNCPHMVRSVLRALWEKDANVGDFFLLLRAGGVARQFSHSRHSCKFFHKTFQRLLTRIRPVQY